MDFADAIGWTDTYTSMEILLFRLGLAAVLGGMIGFEREIHERAAGLRTHILISLAAALFTILAVELFHVVRMLDPQANADPIRSIEAVTAGIAFLGAGSIFRARNRVRGITTGAGMWLAGAIGLACGLGSYVLAVVTAVFALVVLALIGALEARFSPRKAEGRAE